MTDIAESKPSPQASILGREEIAALMAQADQLLRDGAFAQASAVLNQVLQADERSSMAWMKLGACRRAEGDRAAALEAYERASTISPNNGWFRVEVAREHVAAGRREEADAAFAKAREVDPRHAGVLAEIAHDRRRQGDRAQAAALFLEAAACNPDYGDARLQAVRDLLAVGRLDEAGAALDEVLARTPGRPAALLEQVRLRRRQGREAEAAEILALIPADGQADIDQRLELAKELAATASGAVIAMPLLRGVVEARPNHWGAWMQIGLCSRRTGDRATALEAFGKAIAIAPGNGWLRVEAAREHLALGDRDLADQAFQGAREVDPRHIGVLVEIAHDLRRQGRRGQAADVFLEAFAIDPSNRQAWLEAVRDLRAAERLEEAEAQASALIEADPSNAGAWLELGQIRRRRGDVDGLFAALQAAVAADPSNVGAREELARELRVAGRMDEAVATLEALARDRPDSADAALALGRLLLELFRFDEAEAAFGRAEAIEPQRGRALAGLGNLARRRGDRARSLELFDRAAAREPDDIGLQLEQATERRDQGEVEAARAMVQAVIARDPQNWYARMQLGACHRAAADQLAALAAFEEASAMQPQNGWLKVEVARERWALGRPAEAQAALDEARVVDPRHSSPWIVAAEYALVAEDVEQAQALADKAVELDPGNLWPYHVAARAAAQAMDFARADEILRQAAGRIGPQPVLAMSRAQLLRQQRRHREALVLLAEARALHPGNFSLWQEATSLSLSLGGFGEVQAALAAAPAGTQGERANVSGLQGQLEALRHAHGPAAVAFERAAALAPSANHWRYLLAQSLMVDMEVEASRAALQDWTAHNAASNRLRRQSQNVSQSHIGQMLDDFLLDGDILAEVRALKARGPAQGGAAPLEAFADVVRRAPDSTCAAMGWFAAARRDGLIGAALQAGEGGADRPIPRRICQFWDHDPPPDIQDLMQGWALGNPGWEHVRFDDASAEAFLAAHHGAAVLSAFRGAGHPAQRADLFRLAWLAVQGGVYVDADDRCVEPLDRFLPARARFVGYQEDVGTLANNFLAAAPGHPVILRALATAAEALNRGDRDMIWLSTGPGMLTRAFAQACADDPALLQDGGAAVMELWQMNRVIGIHCPVRYKQTGKHWSRAAFRGEGLGVRFVSVEMG